MNRNQFILTRCQFQFTRTRRWQTERYIVTYFSDNSWSVHTSNTAGNASQHVSDIKETRVRQVVNVTRAKEILIEALRKNGAKILRGTVFALVLFFTAACASSHLPGSSRPEAASLHSPGACECDTIPAADLQRVLIEERKEQDRNTVIAFVIIGAAFAIFLHFDPKQ